MARNGKTNGYSSFEAEDPLSKFELAMLALATVFAIIGLGAVILRISGVL
jgi:hypothetical protein